MRPVTTPPAPCPARRAPTPRALALPARCGRAPRGAARRWHGVAGLAAAAVTLVPCLSAWAQPKPALTVSAAAPPAAAATAAGSSAHPVATATAATTAATTTANLPANLPVNGPWPDLQPLQAEIARVAEAAAQAMPERGPLPDGARRPLRIEVSVGTLDARLKLAPCQQVQPYWPRGQRVSAQARIGLRCVQGESRWNVYLPIGIRLWDQRWVAASDLPAGTTLAAAHLREAEVDLAAQPTALLADARSAVGRSLARAVPAGQPLAVRDLRLREWVRAGDPVKVLAGEAQFQISTEAHALGPALEGQPVRARTDSGRVLLGVAIGERLVRVPL